MRSLPPQLIFADLELQFQRVQLDLPPVNHRRVPRSTPYPHRASAQGFGARLEEPPHRTQRHRSLAGAPLAGSHARQELGLSRTARAHPRYAALPLLTASRSPSRMRSTAPSTDLRRRRFVISINSWSRRLSNWGWKTARLSASTPRWWNPTFITRLMPPCCGTRCAPLPASSQTSTRNFPTEYRVLPTAPAALAAVCRPSNA